MESLCTLLEHRLIPFPRKHLLLRSSTKPRPLDKTVWIITTEKESLYAVPV
jgi:hypothetical protein